jgi:glycosyltransferase involved in cell wall biosynthesis
MSLSVEISLVIPALNEKESLPTLLAEIFAALNPLNTSYEVLIIDDGSHDGTFEFLCNHSQEYPWLRALRFRQNMGKAAALQAGFSHSRGKYVFTLDADLQDDPAEVPHMLQMLKTDCDMVSGWKKKRFDPWHKTLPSKLFNRTVRAASGLALHDFNCGLKGYRREVVESISLYGELHRYIPVLAHWNGFRVAEKVVSHRARQHGTSKYGWTRLSNGLFDLLTLLFLHRYMARPLHLFGFLGLLSGFFGSLIIAGFSLQWLVTGAIHMRPLLLGGISAVLLGVQFVSIGLIAELIVGRLPSAPPRLDIMPGENK